MTSSTSAGAAAVQQPSYPLSSASQKHSFAYSSTVHRWPTILTGVVDELSKTNYTLSEEDDADKLTESKRIISDIAGLIYEMRHDRKLPPLTGNTLPDDIDSYNQELERMTREGKGTWFTVSWLYGECYMYRRLRILFAESTHWKDFDPFQTQKLSAFKGSATGVYTLARTVEDLMNEPAPSSTDVNDETAAKKLYDEFVKVGLVCLWGNATDLSLLTSLTHDDIKALQSVERGEHFILHDDFEACWSDLRTRKDARVDIVLDNSGFELYSDLVFADALVTRSGLCKEVVFHPKLIPWFVSDVQPHDFQKTIEVLLDPDFFPREAEQTDSDRAALEKMVRRWQGYISDGTFKLSVPAGLRMSQPGGEHAAFWTTSYPFAYLPSQAPSLLSDLQKSALVVFKGDLNYRKLTFDAWWPTTTSFSEAIGPELRSSGLNILSLRTCKADVAVGLAEGKEAELNEADPSWRVNGKYALISYHPGANVKHQ